MPFQPVEREDHRRVVRSIDSGLDVQGRLQAQSEGACLTLDQAAQRAIAFAIDRMRAKAFAGADHGSESDANDASASFSRMKSRSEAQRVLIDRTRIFFDGRDRQLALGRRILMLSGGNAATVACKDRKVRARGTGRVAAHE